MKKLMFVAAAALCGAVFADSSAITSANVVGYTSKACTAGEWYMVGCGFESTSGGSLDIQKFITGLTARTSAQNPAFIQVWNGTSLDTYKYTMYFDKVQKKQVPGWVKSGTTTAATLAIPAGFTCWFKEPTADATINIAGQVVSAGSTTIPTTANVFTMVANPFPVATTLNGGLIDWSNFTARTSANTPDFIQFWNGTALDTYKYTMYFDKVQKKQVPGWVKSGTTTAATLEIPVGTGFWFKSYTGGDIIFNKTAK